MDAKWQEQGQDGHHVWHAGSGTGEFPSLTRALERLSYADSFLGRHERPCPAVFRGTSLTRMHNVL